MASRRSRPSPHRRRNAEAEAALDLVGPCPIATRNYRWFMPRIADEVVAWLLAARKQPPTPTPPIRKAA